VVLQIHTVTDTWTNGEQLCGGGHVTVVVIQDITTGKFQLFSRGCPPAILHHCSQIWDGREIKQLDPQCRQRITDQYSQWYQQKKLDVVAFSFTSITDETAENLQPFLSSTAAPVVMILAPDGTLRVTEANLRGRDADRLSAMTVVCQQMISHQIFCGMVAMRRRPRQHVPAVIEDLMSAGIRFSYFSPVSHRGS
jgi:magnesium-transporting ATPase (P-type)